MGEDSDVSNLTIHDYGYKLFSSRDSNQKLLYDLIKVCSRKARMA